MNENINEKKPEKIWTKKEAELEIRIILQEIYNLGNNDSEYSRIDEVLKDLKEGSCSPTVAIGRAMNIRDSKMVR